MLGLASGLESLGIVLEAPHEGRLATACTNVREKLTPVVEELFVQDHDDERTVEGHAPGVVYFAGKLLVAHRGDGRVGPGPASTSEVEHVLFGRKAFGHRILPGLVRLPDVCATI